MKPSSHDQISQVPATQPTAATPSMAVQSTPPCDAQAPHCSMLDEMSTHSKPLAPSTAQAVCEAGQRLRRWRAERRERERPAAGEADGTWQVCSPRYR